MTVLAPSPPAVPATGFTVRLPAFTGTLSDLASALRAGRILPEEVPLLALTREVLAWAGTLAGSLEQLSELQHEENSAPHASILCFAVVVNGRPWGRHSSALQVRPAQQNSLAVLGKTAPVWGLPAPLGQKATPFLTNALEAHPEALPALANVIALKARLLLPQPEPDDPDPGDFADDLLAGVLEGVEALAELDALVGFLAARRREREGLIPARAFPLDLPRRERRASPQGSLAKLVRAAQNAVRQVEVPLLARDRLTLADALSALRAFGSRLRTFSFRGIPAADWGERTTYFAALLEGVKEGSFSAEQDAVYGEIQVTAQGAAD